MPALDAEALFALNPRDRKHEAAMRILKELRGIGRGPPIIRAAILALRRAIEVNGGRGVGAIDSGLIVRQCKIEEAYGLSYFDRLTAASALRLDGGLVSERCVFFNLLISQFQLMGSFVMLFLEYGIPLFLGIFRFPLYWNLLCNPSSEEEKFLTHESK